MTSKTRLLELVKAFDAAGVVAALAQTPALLGVRDERGRTWLHICCARSAATPAEIAASIATADVLIQVGLGISDAAFVEGSWRATPLWFSVGRGRNLALAEHLLKLGCDPEHCLWAAGFNRDSDAIRLLVRYGAKVDAFHEEDVTPFVGAIKCSHFAAAETLLELGADPNVTESDGLTAMHMMLKKGSEAQWFEMFVRHGARGDLADPQGRTAIEIMRRKRDPAFHDLADRLAQARST